MAQPHAGRKLPPSSQCVNVRCPVPRGFPWSMWGAKRRSICVYHHETSLTYVLIWPQHNCVVVNSEVGGCMDHRDQPVYRDYLGAARAASDQEMRKRHIIGRCALFNGLDGDAIDEIV